jgi:methionyl-tRNA formyltransferase
MTAPAAARLRLIYMGTAAFAVPALRALVEAGHAILAVYSQPARPAGRGLRRQLSAVGAAAEALGLPLRTPASLKDPAEQAAFADLRADLAVVAAYGLLLPKAILDAPRLGCINLHASLLPRWRGAAPIQRALLAGDRETGITVIRMTPGLDTGPMLAKAPLPIGPATTASELHDRLAALAAELAVPAVARLAAGELAAEPQPEAGATYAHKIDKAEGRLDWHESAAALERRLRALNPWPGCWTMLDEERLAILAGEVAAGRGPPGMVLDDRLTVATGDGALRITRLQRAGGKPLPADAFLRGWPIPAGARLGAPCLATS